MSLQIKLVSGVLTHDTETFTNMVQIMQLRIPTASSTLANNVSDQKPKAKLEKDLTGMKPLLLMFQTISSRSPSLTKTQLLMM